MLKRSLLLSLLLSLSSSAQELEDIFKEGKVSGQLRAFWYDGDRELRIDRTALTLGGILSYKTAPYEGFSGGVSFFSSNGVTSLTEMPESGQTHNLNPDGSSINTLGEAYLQYSAHDTLIRYGRQRLDLPLANDYYNRMLPNSFEALSIESRSLSHTTLKAAYITGWKYKASDTFVSPTYSLGIDRDIAVLGAIYSPASPWKIELYDTYVRDVMNAPYVQIINNEMWKSSEGTTLSGALQYLNEHSVGANAAGEVNTYLLGLRGTLTQGKWSLSALYTLIGDQSLLGSGGRYEKMGWGAFITYTDLQIDGESENAGAEAYGSVLTYRPDSTFEISAKYMRIDQSDAIQSNPASLTQNPRPDSDEVNIDATYQPRKEFRLRTRFALIDYDSSSTSLYQSKAYDETNVRIIADYLF
ncbi:MULTISPECIES: OprD family outer membrane porin [unclassified Sulfuricurvum]|uniref:OprD family outer membrane porin n=1 Tax=unclassified Sulfuricurvum TaxID=2632390 RepID=UPI0002998006|nr:MULTISPECIES: OprD family outer membrane porin [unclassified Sulfuricurvum]AFV96715.1 outer membrane porin [Candidatus Sulfuricurvum sp. RIFRC-1]HBM36166.1 outer membrane porin, OprD family [Sulfuricurvum sp.]